MNNSNSIQLANYVSVFPLIIILFLCTTNLFINKYNKISLFYILQDKILLFGIIFVTSSTQLLKQIPYNSKYHYLTMRPKDACYCDYLSINKHIPENTPGFPSGHMSTTGFFCIYLILFLIEYWEYNNTQNIIKFIQISTFLGTIVTMGWARIIKNCHNLFQVIGGTIYGSCTAILFYNIFTK